MQPDQANDAVQPVASENPDAEAMSAAQHPPSGNQTHLLGVANSPTFMNTQEATVAGGNPLYGTNAMGTASTNGIPVVGGLEPLNPGISHEEKAAVIAENAAKPGSRGAAIGDPEPPSPNEVTKTPEEEAQTGEEVKTPEQQQADQQQEGGIGPVGSVGPVGPESA